MKWKHQEKIDKTTVNQLLFLAGVLAYLAVIIFPNIQTTSLSVSAQGVPDPDNLALSGYGWSATTGWASFCGGENKDQSCPGSVVYQAFLHNFTGDFSGWAWSPSLGYLSFDRRVTNDPPSDDMCKGNISALTPGVHSVEAIGCVDVDSKKGKGWARFIAGCNLVSNPTPLDPPNDSWICASSGAGANSGGWDGWVKLGGRAQDGTDFAITTTPDYRLTSFAWGSEIMGWTSLDTGIEYIEAIPPKGIGCELTVEPLPLIRQVPFEIELTATVTSDSNNPIDYEFDCGNDVKNILQSSSKVEKASCYYATAGKDIILKATCTQNGIFGTDSVPSIYPDPVQRLPAGREEFSPEFIPGGIFEDSNLFQ